MAAQNNASLCVVILAAGMGKRMRSDTPKVLAQTIDGTLLSHVLDSSAELCPASIVVVTGHKRELVEAEARSWELSRSKSTPSHKLPPILFAFQRDQRGTGDAVRAAQEAIPPEARRVLILYGDVPLIDPNILQELLDLHDSSDAHLSLLTIETGESTDYGRVIRTESSGVLERIRELKDCSPSEQLVPEVNSGIYVVEKEFLKSALTSLTPQNAQGELYLTDIVEICAKGGGRTATLIKHDLSIALGVNDYSHLALVNEVILKRRLSELMRTGVSILDPRTVYVERLVSVSPGAVIGPNVQLRGTTAIGAGTVIEGNALIIDSVIGEAVTLKFGVRIESASLARGVSVGPFAHIRPESVLEEEVRVGNFVEVKKSNLRKGAKANHLSYIGDAEVGESSNIGAGTITCNYDGTHKHRTVIGKEVFIGSNSALVAPVTVHDRAVIGAGSVITKNVPEGALGLTRPPLTIKEGWAARKPMKKG